MTNEEMLEKLTKAVGLLGSFANNSNDDKVWEVIDLINSVRYKLENPTEMDNDTLDNVNSPAHYNRGSMECIDIIEAMLTPEEFRGYCKGNTIKYTYRERDKGQDESLMKAEWYLKRAVGVKK